MLKKMMAISCVALCGSAALAAEWTWDFDGSLSERNGAAADLAATGTFSYETVMIGGEQAQVARLDGGSVGDPDAYFTVTNPVGPNGGPGNGYTNIYTLIMDVQVDALPGYVALYQTNTSNSNDGDWFIRGDGGIGISGDYTDAGNDLRFTAAEWHRIALVVDTTGDGENEYMSYMDGQLQNVVQGDQDVDGRFTLEDVFHVFADNSGETADQTWINSLQLRDYAMTASEIAALGGPAAAGIPEPASLGLLAVGLLLVRRR